MCEREIAVENKLMRKRLKREQQKHFFFEITSNGKLSVFFFFDGATVTRGEAKNVKEVGKKSFL